MKKFFVFILCITLILSAKIEGAISLVYNMRISETTEKLVAGQGNPFIVTINPTYAYGLTRHGARANFIGFLQTSAYASTSFFIKLDLAFGEALAAIPICQPNSKTKYSYTNSFAMDDILIKAGYSYALNQYTKFSLQGQLGIPVHKDLNLQYFALGYGHVGMGFQADGRFIYAPPKEHAISCAFRLIQFIPRQALAKNNDVYQHVNVNLGTLIDLLFIHHTVLGPHRIEIGYDQLFLCNGSIHPQINGGLELINFIRAAFFGIYKYALINPKVNHIFLIGTSLATDFWPWRVGNRIAVEPWFTYVVNF